MRLLHLVQNGVNAGAGPRDLKCGLRARSGRKYGVKSESISWRPARRYVRIVRACQTCPRPGADDRIDADSGLKSDSEAWLDEAKVVARVGGFFFTQRAMQHLFIFRGRDPRRRHKHAKTVCELLENFMLRITGRNQPGLAFTRERSKLHSPCRTRTPQRRSVRESRRVTQGEHQTLPLAKAFIDHGKTALLFGSPAS